MPFTDSGSRADITSAHDRRNRREDDRADHERAARQPQRPRRRRSEQQEPIGVFIIFGRVLISRANTSSRTGCKRGSGAGARQSGMWCEMEMAQLSRCFGAFARANAAAVRLLPGVGLRAARVHRAPARLQVERELFQERMSTRTAAHSRS
jgi:hypothetical protein